MTIALGGLAAWSAERVGKSAGGKAIFLIVS